MHCSCSRLATHTRTPSLSPTQVAMELIQPVMFLFQMYPNYHTQYVKDLLPQLFTVLGLEGPDLPDVPQAKKQVCG